MAAGEKVTAGGVTLVAGASGVIGRETVAELVRRGHRVRTLTRRPMAPAPGVEDAVTGDVLRPETLAGACDGVDVIVSAVGGSLDIRKARDRVPYDRLDHLGNRALLEEAQRAGVRRFVYVSVFATPATAELEYVAAHLRFEEALREAALERGVVRPTAVFAFLAQALDMARKGRGVVLGSGAARTNPIHETDVAEAVADAVEADADRTEADVGGPEVMTRREIAEAAFRALGQEPRITAAPPGMLRAAAGMFLPLNRRLSALLRFGTEVSLVDAVAPAVGRRRLEVYFRALAGSGA